MLNYISIQKKKEEKKLKKNNTVIINKKAKKKNNNKKTFSPKELDLADMMFGEASSPFFKPVAGQC